MHDIVEHGPHLLPQIVGRIGAKDFVHGDSLLFPALSSVLGAPDVCGHPAHAGVEPACEGWVPNELSGAPGEFGKYCLGDILRQRIIPPGFAKSGRMHQMDVPFDQFPEGAFGAVGSVALQQLIIGIHLRS